MVFPKPCGQQRTGNKAGIKYTCRLQARGKHKSSVRVHGLKQSTRVEAHAPCHNSSDVDYKEQWAQRAMR